MIFISTNQVSIKMAEAEEVVVLNEGQGGPGGENRKRKYRSLIWHYCEKTEGNFALCILCKAKYQHSNNTSNLSKVTSNSSVLIITLSIYKQDTRLNGLSARKNKTY